MSRFKSVIEIDKKFIGREHPCYVIAEAGVAHFGDINKAYRLLDMAVEAKADVFKLQHFKIDDLYHSDSIEWKSRLRGRELKDKDIIRIKDKCDSFGITFLCTGHTESVLDFLDYEVNVPAFKIGSGEVRNWDYLRNIARRGKPILLSVGMYSLDDIKKTISVIEECENENLAILHCVTNYPANPADINLLFMKSMGGFFGGPLGYSDHPEGPAIPLAAVALGANVLEKHITLENNIPNAQDWKVSCDPSNFKNFVRDIRQIEISLGKPEKIVSEKELTSLSWATKSLVAKKFISKNEMVEKSMFIAQRPGTGLSPEKLENIQGKLATRDINSGEFVQESDFK